MVAITTANVSQSRVEDGSKSRKGTTSNGGVEKAKASHLCRQLQMRLQYARLKVEYGWQKQTLNEVENLYFHLSHTRPKPMKFAPQPTVAITNPEELPPMTSGGTANTAVYGVSPTDRLSTLSYLARNGLSVPSDTGPVQEEGGSGSQNSPTNPLPTPPSMNSTPGPGPNQGSNQNPWLLSQAMVPSNTPAHAEGPSQLHFNPSVNAPIQKPTHPTILSSPPDPPPQGSSQQPLLPPPLKPLGRPPSTPSIIPPEFVSTFGVYMPPSGPSSNEGLEHVASPEGDSPPATSQSAKGKGKAAEPSANSSTNNNGATSPYAVALVSPLRRHNSSSLSFISGAGGAVPAMTYDAFWSSHGAAGRTVNTAGVVPTTAPSTMAANGHGTVVGAGLQSS